MTIAPDPAEITPPHSSDTYARRRGWSSWTVLGLCLFSILVGAAVAMTAPAWWPREAEPVAPVAALPADDHPADEPVAMAQARQPAAPAQNVAGLESRIAALEAGQDRTTQAAAAALASALLAEAASSSRPFERELAALEKVLPLSPDAQALRTLSQRGAPTKAALAAEFDEAASAASLAARDPGEQGGFLDRIGYALASIVTIRRVGSTIGDSPDAVLARAERQVQEGDIDGALTTLNALPAASQRAMAEWRVGAERRASIDRRVASLRATALVNLAQATGRDA
ncbi:MAG TPA: mitofilin family membrane protein [Caulobacteraceae bacterium]|nr:mitofilin family membrane protein [Caulobacteraceae bacterium]